VKVVVQGWVVMGWVGEGWERVVVAPVEEAPAVVGLEVEEQEVVARVMVEAGEEEQVKVEVGKEMAVEEMAVEEMVKGMAGQGKVRGRVTVERVLAEVLGMAVVGLVLVMAGKLGRVVIGGEEEEEDLQGTEVGYHQTTLQCTLQTLDLASSHTAVAEGTHWLRKLHAHGADASRGSTWLVCGAGGATQHAMGC
jgi:hypothetical protein